MTNGAAGSRRHVVVLGACLAMGFALPGWPAPGYTTLLVTSTTGAPVDGGIAQVSPDGRFVLFGTFSTQVLPGGNAPGWLVLDRLLGTGTWAFGFGVGVSMSADGRKIAIVTAQPLVAADVNGQPDVYVRDVQTGAVTLASVGLDGAPSNDYCDGPVISGNGRYVAFYSPASNLVAGDIRGTYDVFVRDLQSGVTELMNVSSSGARAEGISWDPKMSPDGRYVAFWSTAGNLVAGDSRQYSDVFIRDRVARVTERISVSSAGVEANGESYPGTVSADGRYVTFLSAATNLVPGDTSTAYWDSFVRDRVLGVTERVSVNSGNVQANAASYAGTISADGRYVAFVSSATNLVAGDLNARDDVFVRDRVLHSTSRANVSSAGVQSNGGTWPDSTPFMAADGSVVLFNDEGTNLVATPMASGVQRAYVHELGAPSGGGAFAVDPRLDFGDATIHFHTRRDLVFTNTSSTPSSIAALTVTGANAAAFSAEHRCGHSVEAGGACRILVTFHPYRVGAKVAVLKVAAGGTTKDVVLTGRGVVARFSLTPSALSFGLESVGSKSARQTVKVRNTGTTAFPVRRIGLEGADASQFGRLRWCPAVLEPGRVCNVPVWFQPQSVGPKTARLVISPGRSGAAQSVALTGTGR